MTFFNTWRNWASRIKRDSVTLWFAYKHPQTPVWLRLLCVFIVAYALSPIDLIPDFIPVLGYLDDLLLLPILIAFAIRFLPKTIILESRQAAEAWLAEQHEKPRSYVGAGIIIILWGLLFYFGFQWLKPYLITL